MTWVMAHLIKEEKGLFYCLVSKNSRVLFAYGISLLALILTLITISFLSNKEISIESLPVIEAPKGRTRLPPPKKSITDNPYKNSKIYKRLDQGKKTFPMQAPEEILLPPEEKPIIQKPRSTQQHQAETKRTSPPKPKPSIGQILTRLEKTTSAASPHQNSPAVQKHNR